MTGMSRLCCAQILCLAIITGTLAGCGGGGGAPEIPNNPPAEPPPPPQSIGGIVMLGPVENADIEIIGTAGVLATGTSAADGSFGPLDYAGDYTGPLRIRAGGNASSTWVCDFHLGCYDGVTFASFGDRIAYDAVLEAVIPFAEDGQFVSVSILSTLVSKRVDALGTLSSASIESAQADIASTLRQAMPQALGETSLEIPNDFSHLPLFDLFDLPEPGSENDALSLVLTHFNAALLGLNYAGLTPGEFIELLSGQIAANPVLPVGSREFWEPSLDNLTLSMFVQVAESSQQPQAVLAQQNALLAPATLDDLWFGTVMDMQIPRLAALLADPVIDDPDSLPPGTMHFHVRTSDGRPIAPDDIAGWVFGTTASAPVLLTTQPVLIENEVYLRVSLDADVVAQTPVGNYRQVVNIYSTTGEFGRHQEVIEVTLSP